MIYLIHPDYRHYKSFVFDNKVVRKALGSETQFHFARAPQCYQQNWQPFEVSFETLTSKKAAMPDIMVRNGRLFLNEVATNKLRPIMEGFGEFLTITYEGKNGMLFNIMSVAEDDDGLDTKLSSKNEYGEIQALAFHHDRVNGMNIFRTAFDGYMGVYCNDTFKNAIENNGLKGMIFSSDIGTVFPENSSARSPSRH